MNIFPGPFLAAVRGLLCVVVLALGFFTNNAKAQNVDLSTNNVTVDLSVIGDASPALAAGTPFIARPSEGSPRGGLLIPGTKKPISQLHVAVPKEAGRIKLKRPSGEPKTPARRTARKKRPKAKPIMQKPSAPVIAATKPPAPLTATKPPAPMAEKVMPPAPPASERKPEIKAAKPTVKPPVKPKAMAKMAPPAPPATTKAAPPLPPPAVPPAKKPAPSLAAKPKPTPQSAPSTKQEEQASLSPSSEGMKPGRALQIIFGETASKLPTDAKPGLTGLAKKLKGKEKLRLQILAYAGGKSLSPSKARRMSLSRALSIRSFLIESGVRSTRIDVRALGSKTTEGPVNRVDVNVTER